MSESMLREDYAYRQRFKRRTLLGAILMWGGMLVVWVGIIVFMFLNAFTNLLSATQDFSGENMSFLIHIFVLVPLLILGAHLIPRWSRRARRLGKKFYTATDAMDVISRDNRPVVLYLRSFREPEEDEFRYDLRTPEEVLGAVLGDVGPFVAVGNPRDESLILGASRFFLKPGVDWQQFVKDLLSRASLVVIDPQLQGEGLQWEIETALEEENRRKVLFHFLHYQSRSREAVGGLLRPNAAHTEMDARLTVSSLIRGKLGSPAPSFTAKAAFLYFDEEGRPRFEELKSWVGEVFGRESSAVIRETLRPILKRKGLRLGWWKTAARFMTSTTFLILISAVGLALSMFGIYGPRNAILPFAMSIIFYRLIKFILRKLTFQ